VRTPQAKLLGGRCVTLVALFALWACGFDGDTVADAATHDAEVTRDAATHDAEITRDAATDDAEITRDAASDAPDSRDADPVEITGVCSADSLSTGQAREPDLVRQGCTLPGDGSLFVLDERGDLESTGNERILRCLDGLDFDVRAIDFESQQLVIGSVFVGSTCRLETQRAMVVEWDDRVAIELVAFDHSRDCESVCDASSTVVVAAIVDAGLEPVNCVRLDGACTQ
jgi:hypothetical protein